MAVAPSGEYQSSLNLSLNWSSACDDETKEDFKHTVYFSNFHAYVQYCTCRCGVDAFLIDVHLTGDCEAILTHFG